MATSLKREEMMTNNELFQAASGRMLDRFGKYYGVFRYRVFGISVEPDTLFRKRLVKAFLQVQKTSV